MTDGVTPRVILYSRHGCHLCATARTQLEELARRTGEGFVEVDVDADEALRERYGELVPVVTVDGVQQGFWEIDVERVERALRPEQPRRRWGLRRRL